MPDGCALRVLPWIMSQYRDSNGSPLVGVSPKTAVAAAQQEIVNLLKSLWGFLCDYFPPCNLNSSEHELCRLCECQKVGHTC